MAKHGASPLPASPFGWSIRRWNFSVASPSCWVFFTRYTAWALAAILASHPANLGHFQPEDAEPADTSFMRTSPWQAGFLRWRLRVAGSFFDRRTPQISLKRQITTTDPALHAPGFFSVWHQNPNQTYSR